MDWIKKHKLIFVLILLGGLFIIGSLAGGNSSHTENDGAEPVKTEQASKPSKPKFEFATFYSQVKNGMTKAQVLEVAGIEPASCTESETAGLGQSELCVWTQWPNGVTVTFINNAVANKTKTGF